MEDIKNIAKEEGVEITEETIAELSNNKGEDEE